MIKPHTCFSWGKGFFLQKRQQLLEFALTGKLYPLLSATTRFSEVCVCRSNKDDKLLCTGQKTRNTHTHTHFAMLFRICLEIREVALFRRNYLCTYPIKKKNRRCNLYSEQHFFFFFFGLPSMAFYMCNSASFLIRLAVFALILEQTTSTCKKYIHSVTSIP